MKFAIALIVCLFCSTASAQDWQYYNYEQGTVRVYDYRYGPCTPPCRPIPAPVVHCRPRSSFYILNRPVNGYEQPRRGPVNSFFHNIIDLFPHFRY